METVPSQSTWDYAWDRLNDSTNGPANKLIVQAQVTRNNAPVVIHQGEYELDALRAYPPWRTPEGRTVSVQVKAAGPTKGTNRCCSFVSTRLMRLQCSS